MGTDRGEIAPPDDLPGTDDLPLPGETTPVFAIAGETDFSGEKGDYLDAGNVAALSLAAGTIAMTFNADQVWGTNQALFSKDGVAMTRAVISPSGSRTARSSFASRPTIAPSISRFPT